jgi:hypothetical protein
MPANLPPQYIEAEEVYRRAKTAAEKIAALEDMLAVIPKHKGTEKLQADIKRRLARLRDESEKKAKAGRRDPFLVERHGAGQVAVVGFPNVGKSALVGAFTRAKVEVAPYPFATAFPVAGMMETVSLSGRTIFLQAAEQQKEMRRYGWAEMMSHTSQQGLILTQYLLTTGGKSRSLYQPTIFSGGSG